MASFPTHSSGVDTDSYSSDVVMQARCAAGYAVDACKNLQVLMDEYDAMLLLTSCHTTSATAVGAVSGNTAAATAAAASASASASASAAVSAASAAAIGRHKEQVHALSRVWAWVDRVESLMAGDPTVGLDSCGAVRLLMGSGSGRGGGRGRVCVILCYQMDIRR